MTLLFLLPPPASAAEEQSTVAGQTVAPKIEFNSTVFNFGLARMGEILKHDFVFTNTGSAPLEIAEVKVGCGCTTAGQWDKKVEPGKTGVIPLQFNSTGFGGQQSKSATIICNDPVRSNVVLQISGTVWKPIDVVPATVMFTLTSEAQTNETKVMKIINNLDEPITLSDVKSSHASFLAQVKEIRPGREFDLAVTTLPPFTNQTAYATISLRSSSTQAPMVTASASVVVQPAVAVSPPQIFLSPGPLRTPLSRTVMIRSGGTNVVTLSEAKASVEAVQVQVQETQPGRVFNLVVNFPAGFQASPEQKPEVTVKTSHPKFPTITVPILQPVVPKPTPASAGAVTPLPTLPRPLTPQPTGPPAASGNAGGLK